LKYRKFIKLLLASTKLNYDNAKDNEKGRINTYINEFKN